MKYREVVMKTLIASIFIFLCSNVNAWDGYDSTSGTYVQIEGGNLVRSGEDIEIYEDGKGYSTVTVESISGSGSGAVVEVYDYSTGEYRTLDMD